MTEQLFGRLAISLGIGLLIGAERERRKGSGPSRAPEGIRTFALASLAGGISEIVGGGLLLAVTALSIAAFATIAYARSPIEDPGLTTEFALLTTTLLGALAIGNPTVASGFAVIVTVLLAARNRIHHFIQEILTEQELHDALFFAGATLVIRPLAPDRPIGPFGVLNLHVLWTLAVMVMFIGALGHVALRALGPRLGLPLTGLASGFVSSIVAIASMGARVAKKPQLLNAGVAGAVLSTVSTIIQMAVVLWITDRSTLMAMKFPLILAVLVAILYAVIIMTGIRGPQPDDVDTPGRAFQLSSAVAFSATVSGILLISAAVRQWLGTASLFAASGLAGFADSHAAAISVASLVATGKIPVAESVPLVLLSLTTNTVSKIVVAGTSGGREFAMKVIPGLVLVILAAWIGMSLSSAL